MRFIWRLRTTWIWPSPATTCRSPIPIFCETAGGGSFGASTPECAGNARRGSRRIRCRRTWCCAGGTRVARAVLVQARPASCSYFGRAGTPWPRYIPRSLEYGNRAFTSPLSNQTVFGVSVSAPEHRASEQHLLSGFSTRVQRSPSNRQQPADDEQSQHRPLAGFELVLPLQFSARTSRRFRLGPNLRFLHDRENNKKISDIAFKDQAIATVTQMRTSIGTW